MVEPMEPKLTDATTVIERYKSILIVIISPHFNIYLLMVAW